MPSSLILLTGFGPFPGIAVNATGQLVPRLAKLARARFPAYRVRTEILPTEWVAGPARVLEITNALRPAIALHFGVSAQTSGFEIEARGANICRQAADAADALPAAHQLIAGGPAEHGVSLDVGQAVERLKSLGLPAAVSHDAGGYLCNAVLYHALRHAAAHAPRSIVGFVHVPSRIGDDADGVMSWADAERGALAILGVAVGQRGRGTAATPPTAS